MTLATFFQCSAHDMPTIADGSVQAVITSPPYYGLRSYAGEQGVEWPTVTYRLNEWCEPLTIVGCDPECEHEWNDIVMAGQTGGKSNSTLNAKRDANGDLADDRKSQPWTGKITTNNCLKCGGWRGGLGMEPSPVAYLGHLILCLREWRRVLRDDGVALVNLGDSYASNQKGSGGPSDKQSSNAGSRYAPMKFQHGVKEKDLLGIPWLFAIAARADGWYLRSDIIWSKPNPMPESVTDRPTKAHEYVFLLAKNQRYFWDAEAVKEASLYPVDDRGSRVMTEHKRFPTEKVNGIRASGVYPTRNLRSVWSIATQPTSYAHFATWPEKLVEPMIKAATSAHGACSQCGAPYERKMEREDQRHWTERNQFSEKQLANAAAGNRQDGISHAATPVFVAGGWEPTCECAADVVPCTVLDPFNGSGTTGKVAVRLGRQYIGVDIASEYLDGVTAQRFAGGVQMEMIG